MTFAVIPAAGKSSRMGRPKLALPLSGRTVLELVIDALRRGGVEHIVVVVAPHVAELVPLVEPAGGYPYLLDQETAHMRATVEHGLAWLEKQFRPRETDAWFLMPADHPTLDSAVVSALLGAAAAHPNHSIFIPTFEGKRGHPALIRWAHVPAIRAFPVDQGLNAYFRKHAAETLELPVAVPAILWDLNTPDDYRRLLANAASSPARDSHGHNRDDPTQA
jgi:molybdenum cofactor cytidylyltransferase